MQRRVDWKTRANLRPKGDQAIKMMYVGNYKRWRRMGSRKVAGRVIIIIILL